MTESIIATLLEILKQNDDITISTYSNESVNFVINRFLTIWDEYAAGRIIFNPNSHIYQEEYGVGKVIMYKFLRAVFIDRVLNIKVSAGFYININPDGTQYSFGICPKSLTQSILCPEYEDYLPHPNTYYHDLGSDFWVISRSLKDRNYKLSISFMSEFVSALQVSDAVLFQRFLRDLFVDKKELRCVVLPTGESMTALEAIDWLSVHRT